MELNNKFGWIYHGGDCWECPYCHKYQRLMENISGTIVSIYCQFCGAKVNKTEEKI